MKKLVLVFLSFISMTAMAQNLTINLTAAGVAEEGVAVFYYSSPASFFPNGYAAGPSIENFDSYMYTNPNGSVSIWAGNIAPNDTIFWATRDCNGAVQWGSGTPNSITNNTASFAISCVPTDCDVLLKSNTFSTPTNTFYIIEAISLVSFAQTSTLPTNIPSMFYVNGVATPGFSSSTYDSISFTAATHPNGAFVCYARVDSICSSTCDSVGMSGGSGGSLAICNPSFRTDTIGATGAGGYGMIFNNASGSNGTIISYTLDYGDGNVSTSSTFNTLNHTYATPGVYVACLGMTAVLNGDTCSSVVCDTVYARSSNNGGGNSLTCNSYFAVDTANSLLFQNQIIIWEYASTNGTIVSYSWDFGDGTTINTQYPSHTYANTGVYPVCLTIIAMDNVGDTCSSTYCDSLGIDANGNLVYKGMTGFTINIIDPATVGINDLLLDASLQMYPNPAKETVNIEWDASLEVEKVIVMNLAGQTIKSLSPDEAKVQINGLSAGAYLVRIEAAAASKTLRLIVE